MSLRKVMLRSLLTLTSVGILFCATTLISEAEGPSASPLANCYVQLVHLHGKNPPTLTCLVKGKLINGKMVPIGYTNVVDCTNNGQTYMDFFSYANGHVCFTGHGYLGFRLDRVYIANCWAYGGWVREYLNGSGNFWYFNTGDHYNNQYPFQGNTTITQVDIY